MAEQIHKRLDDEQMRMMVAKGIPPADLQAGAFEELPVRRNSCRGFVLSFSSC